MFALRIGLSACAACLWAGTTYPAFADQPATITLSSEAKPVLVGGKLQGCALNFEVGRNDTEYFAGEMVYITGSLNLYTFAGKNPIFALKLGVIGSDRKFAAPEDAFLLTGTKSNASDLLKRLDGEQAGFRLFMFSPGEVTLKSAIEDVMSRQSLTFAYAMRRGGMNAAVTVDMRVRQLDLKDPSKSALNDDAPGEWSRCLEDALTEATDALPRETPKRPSR